MAKYMLLWEHFINIIPEDPKVKKTQLLSFQELVQQKLKEGVIKEYGLFAGETRGYVIFEGDAVDLTTFTLMWAPYAEFEIKEVISIDQLIKATKALPE
jgi:hypothetical protein